MTTQDLRKDTGLLRLAEIIRGRPMTDDAYGTDELLLGLDSERKRLGRCKFLVLLNQSIFDIDGMTDWVYLLESFDSQMEAVDYAKSQAVSLCERDLAGPGPYREEWKLVSTGETPYLSLPESPLEAGDVRALHQQSFKVQSGEFDRKYNCFRMVGPFSGDVVSEELFSFVNAPEELWAYFRNVGEDIRKAAPSLAKVDKPTLEEQEAARMKIKRESQRLANERADKLVAALRAKVL